MSPFSLFTDTSLTPHSVLGDAPEDVAASVDFAPLRHAFKRLQRASAKHDKEKAKAEKQFRKLLAKLPRRATSVRERWGRIDVLVNNAGWDKVGPFLDSDPELWERIVGINLMGTFIMSHAVMTVMKEQGSGTVINIGSDAARVGSTGEAVYSACKGGIVAFSKTMARELARYGVTVNAVCPGPADTPLFAEIGAQNPKLRESLERAIPLRRLAQPTDLANAVAFLADPRSDYITGQTLSVSGGLTMI